MPKRGEKKAKEPLPHVDDPDSLSSWVLRYLEWMRVHGYSERTVENRESYLGFFVRWCALRSLVYPQEMTRPILERYQRYLFHFRKPNGKPLSFRSQHSRLVPVRGLFQWLTRGNVLLANPASELELPKMEKRLPRAVLTASEAERVLMIPEVHDVVGLRDRSILEVFYATGIRRSELMRLQVFDVDFERNTVMVRQGKGKKDRMIPLGERAGVWIEKYLTDARPELVLGHDDGELFLTTMGESFTANRLTQMVRGYVNRAELGKSGSCHLFRHTMATLMLEGGADIRFIQQMLGHVSLETTQLYTQVSIRKLQEIHAATHPGAKLKSRVADGDVDVDDTDDDGGGEADDDTADPEANEAELLASLAAEVTEEAADLPPG